MGCGVVKSRVTMMKSRSTMCEIVLVNTGVVAAATMTAIPDASLSLRGGSSIALALIAKSDLAKTFCRAHKLDT